MGMGAAACAGGGGGTIASLLKPARNFVYWSFLRCGRAPTWADLMRRFQIDRRTTASLLQALEQAHDVVLLPSQGATPSTSYILMSHPFSNIATPHEAVLDAGAVGAAVDGLARYGGEEVQIIGGSLASQPQRTRFYGNWFWDLCGMAHMLAPYARESELPRSSITSACHQTGEAIQMELEAGEVVGTSHPEYTVCFTAPLRFWYRDLVTTWHEHLLLFSDAAQLECWLSGSDTMSSMGRSGGGGDHFVLDEAQLLALSRVFYGGRASADFQRRSAAEVQAVFQAHGLVGDFWALP